MKTRAWGWRALLLLCACTGFVRADDDAQVDADMARMQKAFKAHDWSIVVDMMYPPVLEAVGGRDAAVAMSQEVGSQGKFLTFEAVKPFRHVSGAKNDYVIIPTHSIIQVDDKRVDTTSFELAVRPHGLAMWQYVSAEALAPHIREKYFADLTADAPFPERNTKLLDSFAAPPASLAKTPPAARNYTAILTVTLVIEIVVFLAVVIASLLMLGIGPGRKKKAKVEAMPARRVPPMR